MTPTIVTRTAWGARHEAGDGPAPVPAREVWLHHSVTIAPDLVEPFDDEDAAMRALEQIGEDRFGRGISYTFAVMPTGRIYEGHGVDRLGAHTAKRNSFARAIVLVGNYDTATPTPAQIEATAALLVHGERSGWWRTYQLSGGHRDAPGAATACPGRHAHAAIPTINSRAAAIRGGANQEDDMPLTNDDVERIAVRVTQHLSDSSLHPWALDALLKRLWRIEKLAVELTGREPADVDEAALARELVPLLVGHVDRLGPGDLHDLTAALVTETGRRLVNSAPAPAAALPLAALVEPIVYDEPIVYEADEPLPSTPISY